MAIYGRMKQDDGEAIKELKIMVTNNKSFLVQWFVRFH
jgi:hypothetical protein